MRMAIQAGQGRAVPWGCGVAAGGEDAGGRRLGAQDSDVKGEPAASCWMNYGCALRARPEGAGRRACAHGGREGVRGFARLSL